MGKANYKLDKGYKFENEIKKVTNRKDRIFGFFEYLYKKGRKAISLGEDNV